MKQINADYSICPPKLLFFWDDKTSTYFFVDIPQYPANVWAFRYFSDVIRRLYAD
ncbi:hypothetical protein GCD22_01831 [Acidithiobacillus thiooxidans ATCC 19377]|uniref:Uncharacterized protein n=1 Tax=Acidithiobacillus thiooxidans ATCC 19377 TaxID=637390 RepID=A0A5P9XQ22_ACITH|nr:hypothetical protein GCD22_01831 [Acidithiobacillus thiooxidans ATCC 19377]